MSRRLWTDAARPPIEEIQATVDEAVSPEQTVELRQYLAHINELEAHRKKMEQEILLIAEPFSSVLNLHYTLPSPFAFSQHSAYRIIHLLCLHQFC